MIKINAKNFGWSEVDDEFIMFSMEDNTYYTLNETAKYIWEYIYNKNSICNVQEIVDYMKKRYVSMNIEEIKEDVNDLIDMFVEMKLVVKEDGEKV